MNPFTYIKNSIGELQHINWPTQKQTTAYTILVIVISLLVAVYLGVFDFLFSQGVSLLIK